MRFLTYMRSNLIAIIALVVAMSGGAAYAVNTIRSTDIVDGQVKNADLGANAVTSNKIADNAVTGADVKESTLGKVPQASSADTAWNALALGGVAARSFRPGATMSHERFDQCAQTGTWKLCAPVTVTVPSGTVYNIRVTVAGSTWSEVSGVGLFCASYEGPSCMTGSPTGASFLSHQYTTLADTASGYFGPGTHTFGLAIRDDVAVASSDTSRITTMVEWNDAGAEYAG